MHAFCVRCIDKSLHVCYFSRYRQIQGLKFLDCECDLGLFGMNLGKLINVTVSVTHTAQPYSLIEGELPLAHYSCEPIRALIKANKPLRKKEAKP